MRPVILYRKTDEFDVYRYGNELEIAQKYFYCTDSRLDIKEGDLVVSRMCWLPYAKELEKDILRVGAKPINSYKQHRYIADLANWYCDLEDYTFKTWFRLEDLPMKEPGPFVLKGETNSKKFVWDLQMFAKNREDATQVYLRLLDDALISEQQIYIRKFEKLHTYFTAPRGLPITKEFRIFCAYKKILSTGFYWSSHTEDIRELNLLPSVDEIPKDWLQNIVNIVGESANAYVVDVAQKEDGSWILIECNDLCMSGASDNDMNEMYKNLFQAIVENN